MSIKGTDKKEEERKKLYVKTDTCLGEENISSYLLTSQQHDTERVNTNDTFCVFVDFVDSNVRGDMHDEQFPKFSSFGLIILNQGSYTIFVAHPNNYKKLDQAVKNFSFMVRLHALQIMYSISYFQHLNLKELAQSHEDWP